MLRIRPQQLTAISAASRRDFVARLTASIHNRHPDLVASRPNDIFRAEVDESISIANRHRIEYESHVYQFAVLFLALGADFEKRPDARWAVDILKSNLPPETRLYQLREDYLRRQGAPAA